jgi:hypothetical protein
MRHKTMKNKSRKKGHTPKEVKNKISLKPAGGMPRLVKCPRETGKYIGCESCSLRSICDDPSRDIPSALPTSANEPCVIVNLCDTCAYEFGACKGKPIFASDNNDTVIRCAGYLPTSPGTPTKEENVSVVLKVGGSVVSEKDLKDAAAPQEKTSNDSISTTETAKVEIIKAAPASKVSRFRRQEDLGNCQSCKNPLKRTALNRDIDAVRCINPRCSLYRVVIKNIPAR